MPVTRSTNQRGYGAQHQAERKRWTPLVKAGRATCARCGGPIAADGPWDLGHNDDRTAYTGPEHVSCNRSAGGRNGAAMVNTARQMTVRDW